jgi:hypothetical protein
MIRVGDRVFARQRDATFETGRWFRTRATILATTQVTAAAEGVAFDSWHWLLETFFMRDGLMVKIDDGNAIYKPRRDENDRKFGVARLKHPAR